MGARAMRWAGSWAAYVRTPVQDRRGWAGWAAKPSSLGCEAFFLISFFCFLFLLP